MTDPEPADQPAREPADDRPTRPTGTARRLLTVAGLLIMLQALALIAFAVAEANAVDAARVGLGVSTAFFFGVLGLGLLFAVSRILAGHAWARGLLVFSQLLCLVLAFNVRGEAWWIPTAMVTSALVSLGCLLSPPVTRALGVDDPV